MITSCSSYLCGFSSTFKIHSVLWFNILMTNREIARIFFEMAALWEMEGVQFKPRAYEKAALGIEGIGENARDIYEKGGFKELMNIPGVGKGIALHIEEMLKTGHFKEYEQFKKRIPVNITELMGIQGLGPKMIKVLYDKLKIRNLEELEKAARTGKIRTLKQFGEKSEQKILKGIEFLKKASGRQILGWILPEVRNMEAVIRALEGVKDIAVAGSIRRMKETIGDIDFLVTSDSPEEVMEHFLKMSWIDDVYGTGPTKTNVRLKNGLDADLRIVPEESFGAALCYFTGSKSHNISLREIAVKKGWKLNEYGLYEGERMIAGRTEEEIYRALGLQYVEPEMREDTGEVDAARKKKLPELIGYDDLRGDLQIQTDWTDGEDSIEAMADAGEELGLEYIVITDHTKGLAMTGGSDEKKLLQQMKAIDAINKKRKREGKKLHILKGAEVNIMKDGSLDIEDEVLAQLDVVGAAVHHHFHLSRDEQTKRVIHALENPNMDILFHPTSRIIQRRDPIELDMDAVIEAAKRTATVLEIDGIPDRMDLKDEYVRKCIETGVKMSIDSDAHACSQMKYTYFGVANARRGWAQKKDIVNTYPLKEFLAQLKGN